jgi:trimeric autotransporter adhesin
MNVRGMRQGFHFSTMVALFCASAAQAWCAPAATTTTLAITSGGNPVTTVASGSMVTLTATVVAGTTPVTVGQVNFCDAAAKYCTDVHIVGTAQLIQTGASAGTAVFRFIPGIGSHSYKAVFAGTPNAAKAYAASTSVDVALAVTGTAPTITILSASGSPGNYSLGATVYGTGKAAPTGTVSFLDTNSGNAVLGTAALDPGTQGFDLAGSAIPLSNYNQGPVSLSVADFNGDGIPDLAVVTNGLDLVTILLGNGDGTFMPGRMNPAASFVPNSFAVGDFNGDGIVDLAVTDPCGSGPTCVVFTTGSITILLGNGDGTFKVGPAGPGTGTSPVFIATGDFNGDGILDLAVSTIYWINETDQTASIEIFLGKGDGTFSATPNIIPTSGTRFSSNTLWVGDFNGDGIADLVLGDPFTVFLNNGDGTFHAAASPGISGVAIATGDFNGDGKLDLILSQGYLATTVLLGNGDGTFKAIAGPPVSGLVAVGDFNGDGIADLAFNFWEGDCTVYGDGGVAVLVGNGDGTFKGAGGAGGGSGLSCADSIVVGDFTGAGIADLALVGGVLSGYNAISIALPQLTETATATGISPVGNGTHQVEASYPGDSNYGSNVSSTVPLTALPKPAFAIAGAAVSIAAGATAGNTSSVTLTPSGGFTGSVTLTAKITAQPNAAVGLPTLSFGTTTPVSITGAAGGTATLTISTTASSSCTAANRMERKVGSWAGGTLLACVFLFMLPRRRRRWQSILGSLLLLLATCSGVLACGGGSKVAGCTAVAGTTPGDYTITVTGISAALTETGTISLTVK